MVVLICQRTRLSHGGRLLGTWPNRELPNNSPAGSINIPSLSFNDITVGLDAKRMETDMADPKWQTVIDKNRALARELGISGTPGFIVGNELVPGALDLNVLKELIARAGQGK
ncbi:MAG: DsbA family protein [Nitrospira sp.]|nr:DsbA family protein [Nitrospira sp.]